MRNTAAALLLILGASGSIAAEQAAPTTAAAPLRNAALRAFDARIEATKQAMMGDPSVARKAAEQAVRMAQSMAGDASVTPRDAVISLATAKWLLGEAHIGLNDATRARSYIGEALSGVERFDRGSKLHGDLLRSRATLAEMAGNVQGALRDYLAAYRIFRAVGQARSQAIALQDIGGLYLEAQDYEKVRSYYSQSFDAFSEDPWLNLATYNNRGQSFREEKRFAEAEVEFRKALASARKLESPLLEARILTNIADAQLDMGKTADADRTIALASRLVQSGEGVGWRPFTFGVQARIAARRGDVATAAGLLDRAFAGQELDKTEMGFRDLHKAAAGIYEALGRQDAALAHLKAYQRLDREALRLTASASSQLLAARFDFANQNLRIANLKQGQLQRDITIERQANQFRTNLFIGLGTALLVIFGLMAFGYLSIRRSRDQVRAANDDLNATNVELEKALKARTDFLATTSHEIRTPLNGILGMAQVLLADRRLAGDVRERVELLRGAGETMKTLVDDILDVAKMESGEFSVTTHETDLSRLIADTCGLWRQAAANKKLVLESTVEQVPARVLTDGERLRQILSNLLSNAIKFTGEGMISFHARGLRRDGTDVIEFAVRDTGIGISADDQQRIFEAFTQVNNSTTREYSGTGLGLAISQRLARALGGSIGLVSAPGEGACFTLTLPVEVVGEGHVAMAAENGEAADSLAGAAMLLVERNLGVHALMRMLLGAETRLVEIAISTEDALGRMAAGHFDHVLIEAASAGGEDMPAIDGIRAILAEAAKCGARTSLLAAPSEALDSAQLFAVGADQLILKPIAAADLIVALRKLYDARVESRAQNPAEERAA